MTQEELKGVIQRAEYEECLATFRQLRPQQVYLIKQFTAQGKRCLGQLLAHLKSCLSSLPTTFRIETISVVKMDSETFEVIEDNEYPSYYPFALQKLLIDTRKMVSRKRDLSNSLHTLEHDRNGRRDACDEIDRLSEQITHNYKIKLQFDKTGILADELLAVELKLPEGVAELKAELQRCMSRIAKNKAKLKNPKELKTGKAREWREKLEMDESRKTALLDKLKLFL